MFDELINAITQRLVEHFSDSIPNIYSENIEQDFIEPCFYISLINSTNKSKLGPRRSRRYKFDVMYFNGNLGHDNLNSMGDSLSTVLEDIQVNENIVHGFDIEYEIRDGRLHLFVEYPMDMEFEVKKETKMAGLKERIGLDG